MMRRPSDIGREAAAFARGDPGTGELRLMRLAGAAIAGWRLDEAIFWQRVKFRARMIRATGGRATIAGRKE